MNKPARWSLLSVAFAAIAGCGVKAPPRPPEDTAARPPQEVRAITTSNGVRIEWRRPENAVDGKRLDDLSGFLIERSTDGLRFETIATVEAVDRERLRPRRNYQVTDPAPVDGVAVYRVTAFTVDGQHGLPSAVAEASPPAEPASE